MRLLLSGTYIIILPSCSLSGQGAKKLSMHNRKLMKFFLVVNKHGEPTANLSVETKSGLGHICNYSTI